MKLQCVVMTLAALLATVPVFGVDPVSSPGGGRYDYRLLATTKTSTMEKEMNQAAEAGYVFSAVMGGETAFGGKETVVVMSHGGSNSSDVSRYKLLATNKTSTMEKELNQAGREGFAFRGVTVFESAFGGREVAVILERAPADAAAYSYRVQATNRTSTMEKELKEVGREGYKLQGMCVAKTAFGGNEVVAILARTEAR